MAGHTLHAGAEPVEGHLYGAERRPVSKQQNPYADKKLPGALHAKRTGARPPTTSRAARRGQCGAADAAPRAAGVLRDRAEDRDRGQPQGPKPGATKRPVAETPRRQPEDKTWVAQKTGAETRAHAPTKYKRPR